MNLSMGTTRVDEVMTEVVFTIGPREKMVAAATLFEKNDVNAAPVVDPNGVCIGILTSHDVVEYESVRIKVMDHLDQGLGFDLGHYGDGQSVLLSRLPIDEVGIQMTTKVSTVEPHTPLSQAARTMCAQHIHHLVILDEGKRPVGILSSLDILSHLTGEPLIRHGRSQ